MVQKTLIKMAALLLLEFIVNGAVCTERLYLDIEDFLAQENDSLAALGGTVHGAPIGVSHGQEPCPACA